MRIAIVGVTGLVGSVMLKVLEDSGIAVSELIPVASARSVGSEIMYSGKSVRVVDIETGVRKKPHIALFSAGAGVSRDWAPEFAEVGTFVIDNSSAWRMDPAVPLVVPEINGHLLDERHRIIANPNCSTIQLVMVLAPLHDSYGLERIVVSTYQSVTGTGKAAVDQYRGEANGDHAEMVYPHRIFGNCIPHCDIFLDNGYTKEEMKLVNESRKILDIDDLKLTATAVRVPVTGGHSESVNIELRSPFDLSDVRALLNKAQGVVVMDDPGENVYPMPIFSENKDDVFVGRIRRDASVDNGLNLWIVADNLRKGAATNAVQIAEMLVHQGVI